MERNIERYADIFDEKFLDYFRNKSDKIKDIKFEPNKFEIDLTKILNILNLTIDVQDQSETRKRFTIAEEIGHHVLNHEKITNKLKDNEEYATWLRIKERSANQFAASLLMPEKLIDHLMIKYMNDKKMYINDFLKSDAKALIEYLANSLNVSNTSMEYRLFALDIIGNA